MIIDDEEAFLNLAKLNLEIAGDYEVLTLLSAEDIIARINSFTPDIILMDILMPSIGGLEACEMLNKDPVGKNIPIIILSALEKEQDKLKAYKAGVVDYIVKPADINTLIFKIEKALQYK